MIKRLKTLWYHVQRGMGKYQTELGFLVASAVLGVVLSRLADVFLAAPTVDQIQIGLLASLAVFTGGLAFIIRRNLTSKLLLMEGQVNHLVGRTGSTQFDHRERHFAQEKARLIEELVRHTLPGIVRDAVDSQPKTTKRIALLIDSGTTLQPLFAKLKYFGLHGVDETQTKQIKIFTNNTAGSDAYSRQPHGSLTAGQLHLFGGTPIEKYRAVLGDVTVASAVDMSKDYSDPNDLIIGLITANWIIVGDSYDQLFISSSEDEHLKFKQKISEVSDILLVVAPLGKLQRVGSVEEFNTVLDTAGHKVVYRGFDPCLQGGKRTKSNTLLLTTKRKWPLSVLKRHSDELERANARATTSYKLLKTSRSLELDHRLSRDEQIYIEMPHEYLQDAGKSLLNIQ